MWYFIEMVNWFSHERSLVTTIYEVDKSKLLCENLDQNVLNISGGSVRKPRSRSRSGSDYVRISRTKMKACALTSVFFILGAISAIFLVPFFQIFDTGFLRTDFSSRKQVFQPLPQVEHLQISDEHDYIFDIGSGLGIRIDPDGECEGDNPLGLELEAVSALHVALEMKEVGKISKAQRLFQHAMALCPRHPDILTHYGEFFEKSHQDYIMADHLYVQALTHSPHHTKALINRKRTLPVVEELDERRLQRIDEKRDILIQMPESSNALRRVKKEAYFQHLYHTAGIEGNTMTLSETRLILETRLAVGGKSILEHNEILGLDAAMKYINSSLVHRIGAITADDILNIHKHLMGYVDPGEAGQFRQTQVYVGSHIPPRPKDIPENINQLIQWLNSEEALVLHPIHYAAIAHYKLDLQRKHTVIPVYGDMNYTYGVPWLLSIALGNLCYKTTDGWILNMNWVLMQAGYPPVIIRKQDRQLYYDHLNTANKGDIRPFIRFIADCTEKTVDVYLWATRELGHIQMLGSESEDQEENQGKTILKQDSDKPNSEPDTSSSSSSQGSSQNSNIQNDSNDSNNNKLNKLKDSSSVED